MGMWKWMGIISYRFRTYMAHTSVFFVLFELLVQLLDVWYSCLIR